jgi:phosphoribosylanthranilate isomerase
MTRVKICGLTRLEDAQLAVQHGAWALGVIMWPDSPRHCTPQQAADIASEYRRSAEIVGVFVDAKLDYVTEVVEATGMTMVQLHGDEGQQYAEEVARRTGARVIKALRVKNRSVLSDLKLFRDVDYHLLDTYKAGMPGGTGETFDWSFVRERAELSPLILSGGLTPENVGEAIDVVAPFGVDVSSGIESAPGVKDPDKMRAFFEAVRSRGTEEPAPVDTGEEIETLTLGPGSMRSGSPRGRGAAGSAGPRRTHATVPDAPPAEPDKPAERGTDA